MNNKPQFIPFSHLKKRLLKDPEFKKEYDSLETEYKLIESLIRKRLEKGITQKQLAKRMDTKQSAISRLEGGNANPSLNFLQKVATALGTKLTISFQ